MMRMADFREAEIIMDTGMVDMVPITGIPLMKSEKEFRRRKLLVCDNRNQYKPMDF